MAIVKRAAGHTAWRPFLLGSGGGHGRVSAGDCGGKQMQEDLQSKGPEQSIGLLERIVPWMVFMGGTFFAGLFVLVAVALLWNEIQIRPRESLMGLALMASGVPFYWYWARRGKL